MLSEMSRTRQRQTAIGCRDRHRRLCLYCGFDGSQIQRRGEGAVFHCPACGGDLYARPPRSYAEMEGFADEATEVGAGADGSVRAEFPGANPSRFLRLMRLAGAAVALLVRAVLLPLCVLRRRPAGVKGRRMPRRAAETAAQRMSWLRGQRRKING